MRLLIVYLSIFSLILPAQELPIKDDDDDGIDIDTSSYEYHLGSALAESVVYNLLLVGSVIMVRGGYSALRGQPFFDDYLDSNGKRFYLFLASSDVGLVSGTAAAALTPGPFFNEWDTFKNVLWLTPVGDLMGMLVASAIALCWMQGRMIEQVGEYSQL